MNKTPIGKRLKQIREKTNITMYKLNKDLGHGKTGSVIWQFENDKCNPKFKTIKKISKYFKIPIYFFYIEDDALAETVLNIFYKKQKK
jgi:transcriptional regulator with XRE-family HTH domain